jgi:hypothetical protein
MSGPEIRLDGATRDRADAEQRLAAWMAGVAPGRAPVGTIEAGLAKAVARRQAPGWLPKVGPAAARGDGPPTRLLLAVGAIGLLALAGGLLAVGAAPRPAPSTDVAPRPSQPAVVSSPAPAPTTGAGSAAIQALATTWVGGTRDIPAIGEGPFRAVVDLTGGFMGLLRDGTATLMPAQVTAGGPGAVHLVSTEDGAGCAKGDAGTYPYAVAGHRLTIRAGVDDCAARAALLPGSWDQADCRTSNNICLDTLDPGTHATTLFRARRDAVGPGLTWPAYPQVTYTVPPGWTNAFDGLLTYDLEPTAFFDTNFGTPGADLEWRGIYLRAQPAAAAQPDGCDAVTPLEGVGSSIDALATWLAGHPGLAAGDPTRMVVGGRPAIAIDLAIEPAWTRTGGCPNDPADTPMVTLLVSADGSSGYDWSLFGSERMRVILVDLGPGGVLAIAIDTTDPATFDDLLAQAMPIVESFRFAER